MERVSEKLPMPAGYFDLVIRHLGSNATAAAALLDGTGISRAQLAKPDAQITLGQALRLVRNANRALPPGWSLDIGRAFQPSAHGPLGIAAISAPTLWDAFDVIAHTCHLRHPAYRASLVKTHGQLHLEINQCVSLFEEEHLALIEVFLLSMQGIAEAIIGRPMTEGRFDVAAPAPSYASRYADYFHADVKFDTRTSAMILPAEWATIRCPFADSGMYAAALKALEAQARKFDSQDYTAAHVEHLMAVTGDPGLSLADAAQRLNISERTLMRRLHDSGTTFRELRDAHRRRRAESLLRDGTMTVAELGYRLGYEDSANFNRACRRWFGRSPGLLRQKHVDTH